MSQYPEHDKLQAVKNQSQLIGEFLEWLNSQGLYLAAWQEIDTIFGKDSELVISYLSINDILARFFEIDLDKLEDEKRQMLDSIREMGN